MAPNVFRYPGGKKKVREQLVAMMPADLTQYAELFCGGASVALLVAETFPTADIYLADTDEHVTAFWWALAEGHAEELARRYETTTPTLEECRRTFKLESTDPLEMAWAGLYNNRTFFSGKTFTTPIGGWHGTNPGPRNHVGAEYRQAHVAKAVREAGKLLQGRTLVTTQSWEDNGPMEGWFLYLDPPYYAPTTRMYRDQFTHSDHLRLAAWLQERGDWLLSYDDHEGIRYLYSGCDISTLELPYSAGKQTRYRKTELVIRPQRRAA